MALKLENNPPSAINTFKYQILFIYTYFEKFFKLFKINIIMEN